jgi:CO dehydrogenase/acetyl-CoA synthase beta subunit
MKFTKDTIRQLIAEEIENYLNEQDDSDPIDILRRLMKGPEAKAYLDKLEKAREENPEEEFEEPEPLPPGEEKQYPAADPDAVLGPPPPGFQLDADEAPAPSSAPASGVGPTGTTVVKNLADTEIGKKPAKPGDPARTQLRVPRN